MRSLFELTDSFRDQIVCITIINHADILSELEIAIHERYGDRIETYHFENSYSPGWYWLTIYSHKATKAQAILTLQETYGLSSKKLIVFGDHNNDIEMFRIADWRVFLDNIDRVLKSRGFYLNCQWITPPARREFEEFCINHYGSLETNLSSEAKFEIWIYRAI
ncbi:HAD hydrolase family protein [Nostoc sp.]|uniref:HAD hydrolase family protein n=1 Tax=Nostoc sp. TaxID=1180 RepID=UPI002FF581E0